MGYIWCQISEHTVFDAALTGNTRAPGKRRGVGLLPLKMQVLAWLADPSKKGSMCTVWILMLPCKMSVQGSSIPYLNRTGLPATENTKLINFATQQHHEKVVFDTQQKSQTIPWLKGNLHQCRFPVSHTHPLATPAPQEGHCASTWRKSMARTRREFLFMSFNWVVSLSSSVWWTSRYSLQTQTRERCMSSAAHTKLADDHLKRKSAWQITFLTGCVYRQKTHLHWSVLKAAPCCLFGNK